MDDLSTVLDQWTAAWQKATALTGLPVTVETAPILREIAEAIVDDIENNQWSTLRDLAKRVDALEKRTHTHAEG
jgi:hypothetical protein